MSETALDRVARALDLIPFITNNPGLSVVQIAQRFHSTPVQISKDLTLLHMCGLPGYSHLELLDIDYEDPNYISVTEAQVLDQPRSLTQVEAMTLVLGLQLLSELTTNPSERESISALKERIVKKYGSTLSRSVSIADAVIPSPLAAQILEAISEKRWLILDYNSASSDSLTTRNVFPLHIYYVHGIGYLRAYAREAEEERTFRLDRITQMRPGQVDLKFGEEAIARHSAPADSEVPGILIEMGEDGYFFIERHNEIVTSFEEIAGRFRIRLGVVAGEWILRTLLAWPSRIEILEPASLSSAIHARLAGTLSNYQ